MAPTDIPLSVLGGRILRSARLLVCAGVVVGSQARLESVRWWSSPPIISVLAMTPQQSAAIERVYEESLPARQRAGEDASGLSENIATRLSDGLYDDEQLQLTAELAGALNKQCALQHRAFELALQVLTPPQRDKLTRLIAERRLIEE